MQDQKELHPDYQSLFKVLRQAMKNRKMTYGKMAKKLGVSEVTVKRRFSGHTCSFATIFEICRALGVSFLDLAALAKKEEELDFVLSEKQESFFSKKPALFGVFKMLFQGAEAQEVMRQWKLNTGAFYSLLRSFEKQGLLEVLPENRFRMKGRGNIRSSHRGPLSKAILRPQILQFLDHVDLKLENEDVCMHSAEVALSRESISEFVEEVHALGAKYRARALRDQSLLPKEKLESTRWLLVLAPYLTNWRQYSL